MSNTMQKAKLEWEQLHVGARLPVSPQPHRKVRVSVLVPQFYGARHNWTRGPGASAGMSTFVQSVCLSQES